MQAMGGIDAMREVAATSDHSVIPSENAYPNPSNAV